MTEVKSNKHIVYYGYHSNNTEFHNGRPHRFNYVFKKNSIKTYVELFKNISSVITCYSFIIYQ